MKKCLIIAAMLLGYLGATAQTPRVMDTIYGRNPTYMYPKGWTDPFDSIQHPPLWGTPEVMDGFGLLYTAVSALEQATKFYTDTTVKIIGAAAAAGVSDMDEGYGEEYADTNRYHWYETLKIYKHVHDSMVMVREKEFYYMDTTRWTYSYPGRRREWYNSVSHYFTTRFFPVYEVYFDKPYEAQDSFYVAITFDARQYDSVYNDHDSLVAVRRRPSCNPFTLYYADTNLYHISTAEYDSLYKQGTGTAALSLDHEGSGYKWIFNKDCVGPHLNTDDPRTNNHPVIGRQFVFPIIDTTGMGLPPHSGIPCHKVTSLRVPSIWDNHVLFTWEGDSLHNRYELAVGKADWDPSLWTTYRCNTTSKVVDYLDSNVTYGARVRAECTPKGNWSDWSDTINFSFGTQQQEQKIENLADRYTYLMPNPATDRVQVLSSVGLQHVTLYDMKGRMVLDEPAHGLATQLNLAGLPEGTYMMVIVTPAGTAMKKLAIAR
ncbi:MAG: T9SS type A sorting domain-containing protein [Bacteroidales bacterium]|nr:T9SS type A sorting domain-containing protein [Bacteroidales bacterium]